MVYIGIALKIFQGAFGASKIIIKGYFENFEPV